MRKQAAIFATAGLMSLGSLAFAAPAQGDEGQLHGHVLVLGVKYVGGEPVGFRKCVDLAAGRPLPLKAHHAHAHTGKAGQALEAAGHFVLPTAPYSFFRDCAHLRELFPA